jgi:hypothetical protein
MKTFCVVSTRFSKAVLVFAHLFRSDRHLVVARSRVRYGIYQVHYTCSLPYGMVREGSKLTF